MKCVDDFRLKFGDKEYVPIIIGGMGVDISTPELALEAARLGGIGHISDAMAVDTSDKYFGTLNTRDKALKYKNTVQVFDKKDVVFDLDILEEATKRHVESVMSRKVGSGLIFINCMERLTMNAARDTLKIRLNAAIDAGIDGVTLAAGLHANSMRLIADNPRFRDVKIGIIVSSLRALQIFLRRNVKLERLPDYIVVEGPLAGGHLGFSLDWQQYDLKTIVSEIVSYVKQENLNIPVIAAGGIFTGTDAVEYLESGVSGVQVATRFVITKESGLPEEVKQVYLSATIDDIAVNQVSPTGYPMRMLKSSPALNQGLRPNCEAYGYILENGQCEYLKAYQRELEKHPDGENIRVPDKTCLCTCMRNYFVWTCGHYTYRLKETTHRLPNGSYYIPSAEHVFKDYQFSKNHEIKLPDLTKI